VSTGAIAGSDGKLRCPWGLSAPEYVRYHDEEWGRPVRGDQAIFERLCLEAFQSGLSWLTILRKRENFRAAFAGFDMAKVAMFGDEDRQRLMADAGIVRNRAKINAVIVNAQAALSIPGGLSDLVWRYQVEPAQVEPAQVEPAQVEPAQVEPPHAGALRAEDAGQAGPQTLADVPAKTPASTALSKELRRNGFVFTGPVTAYATMQACGIVNDHLSACFARYNQ
jgi:DNA-3-methyladenine glycosylase I